MTTLLELVAPLIGDEALDTAVVDLLAGVTTAVPALTEQVQVLGVSSAEPLWRSLSKVLPAPPMDVPPFPDGLPVSGRRLGATGWEISIDLPAFDIPMPAVQPGVITEAGGRKVATAVAGTAMLRVAAGHALLRAPNGADAAFAVDDLVLSAEPDVIVLPGSFGLQIGELRVAPEGIELPSLKLLLPPLPQLPTGPIPIPATLRRMGGALVQTPPVDLPAIEGFRAAAVAVTIDRPDATSIADLIPTLVQLTVPLDGVAPDVPGIGSVSGAAIGGGPLALAIELSSANERVTLRGSLAGNGDERGVLRLTGGEPAVTAALAIVAALGPYLADEGDDAAQLALLGAAAIGLSAAVDAAEAAVVVHSVTLSAAWDAAPPGMGDIDVTIDYECRLPLSFDEMGVPVHTRTGAPYCVRHRGVTLRFLPVPGLSWRGAGSTVTSPGDWVVPEILEDLLRVAGVKTRKGSLDLELDLRLALDLGVVKVQASTVRVSIEEGGDITVTPPDFSVSLDIPGVVTGQGRLAFGSGGFEAALDVALPSLGAGGRAAVGVRDGMIMLAIRADLFVPIPLANSGLGLYSVGGVLAADARPRVPGGDPIAAALAWSPWRTDAWEPGDQVWMGFLASIGTLPDLGFALSGEAVILLGVPEPALRASLRAEVLAGFAGTLDGVLTIDAEQLVIAVRGHYELPHLVVAEIPAGAIFPFADTSAWSVRIGGDRTPQRGEPVMASILPDLLQLEAWTFLMAFGAANTRVGDALSGGHGLELHGMSLAFGAGFDVEWSAGPFAFAAGGVLLAALTHRPSTGEGPWVLTGFAELHGSVDLGPVSIGASAQLSAFADPDAGVFYADAKACASIDLWFTEIEGCVHVEIGAKPTAAAPAPPSPLRKLALSDRVGNVVAEAVKQPGPTPPVVWPDVIPVIVFETWVGAPASIPGLGTVIGANIPAGDGWIGTAELAYRFDLTSVRVVEIGAGGETEVGGTWPAAWQLPLTDDVFGAGEPPAQARSLALNVLDLHHWLQPAVMLPQGAPGHPAGVLGRLCDPVPGPAPVWYPGGGAVLPPREAMRIPAADARPGDPAALSVFLQGESRYPADRDAPTNAWLADHAYRAPGIEALAESAVVDGRDVGAVCWMPLAYHSDSRAETILHAEQPLHDATLYLVMPEESLVAVDGDVGGPWSVSRDVLGRWVLETWRAPGPVTDIVLRVRSDQQVGLVGVAAVTERAIGRWGTVETGRAGTHAALEAKAANPATARRILRRDRRYRVEVNLHWQSRGTMYQNNSGDVVDEFFFSTAAAGTEHPPPPLPGGAAFLPFSVFAAQVFLTMFDQSVLAGADLGRYVAGFVPTSGTTDWFTADPVQVQFLVDHLAELAAQYDSTLTVTARRTDAAPGTPPAAAVAASIAPPQAGDPGLLVAAPLVVSGLTTLDRARLALAVAMDAQPGGCRFPRPGAAATVPLVLVPRAAYRATLTVDVVGAALGSGTVIGEAVFTTSRYSAPIDLLGDLGFDSGPPGRALASFPLPADARRPGHGDRFDDALEALSLGGYSAPGSGGSAALWRRDAGGPWQFLGVLVECPEAIQRPGRLHVDGVLADGVPFPQVIWDGAGTRLLALATAGAPAPAVVTLRVTDARHGEAAAQLVVSALVQAFEPELALP